MNLQPRRVGAALVLKPAGLIDHLSATSFEATLGPQLQQCKCGGDTVVLDLADLEYISSAGLRVLMLAAKQVKAAGGRILLAAPQPVVREILEISRFNLVFELADSVDAAVAAAGAPKA